VPSAFLRSFAKDESAVVAATYALLLVPIVGLAGVAYDFAQMAALDTEVQNAADHAALAAVTQLDGTDMAMDNATSAANNLLTNLTMMAADGKAAPLSITSVVFYDSNNDAENDTNSFTDTSKSASAKYVKVTIETRKARFALTPIVGVLWSPDLGAEATAGMGSAICRVPPVMMCNPAEGTDDEFNNNYVGDGIELVSVGSGGGAWAPGNFGYLDVNAGDSGNPLIALKKALGWDSPPGDCLPETGVSTKTGADTPVTEALNTRFDIFDGTGPGGGSCPTGGGCSPSINTVKDLIRSSTASKMNIGPNGWQVPTKEYQPVSLTNPGVTPTSMGHPRDICHSLATPNCASYSGNSHIGNGNWDRATYFQVNYPGFNWQSALGTSTPTRYQVYRWEIAHRNDTYTNSSGATVAIGARRVAETSGAKSIFDYNKPVSTAGINPDDGGIDRRTFPVAVVNCTANNVRGNSNGVPVVKWMNMFLVEPSANRARTSQQEVYVEVVSVNDVGNNDGGAAAVVRRDKPYLIK
jgi:Flp pilus assembly protein TadG